MRGVCMHTAFLFVSWHVPIRTQTLRHTHRMMNRFKMFILCFSPETSLLVSPLWEHPLGIPALIHVSSRLPYQLEHLCWAVGQPLPLVTGLAKQWGWCARAARAYPQTCPLGRASACDERADPGLTTLFLETLSMAFLSLSFKGIPSFAYVMM